MGSYASTSQQLTNKDITNVIEFETIDISDEYALVRKKTKMLKELKEYIENTDQESVYHKHMIGTKEYIGIGKTEGLYTNILCSNILFTLISWPLYNLDYVLEF